MYIHLDNSHNREKALQTSIFISGVIIQIRGYMFINTSYEIERVKDLFGCCIHISKQDLCMEYEKSMNFFVGTPTFQTRAFFKDHPCKLTSAIK